MRLTTICALAVAMPLAAQPPTPSNSSPTPLDSSTLTAARRMVAASDIQQMMRSVGPAIGESTMAQIKTMFGKKTIPEALALRLQAVMQRDMASMADILTPEVQDQMASVYARHFSATELNRIADLMSDPVMATFRERMPAVTRDLLPVLDAAMAPSGQRLADDMKAAVADWVLEHPEDAKWLRGACGKDGKRPGCA